MNKNNYNEKQTIQINCSDRWQIYRRLQDLEIDCSCQINRPLQVNLHSCYTLVQTWSAIEQFTASRQELIEWLNKCWQYK